MKINEIFYSIQGEGFSAGRPRLFIRTSGCTLKCAFCDTKYHIKGRSLNKKDISLLKKYKKWVFTGGEPLLWQNDIIDLIKKYKPTLVEFETNGTIPPQIYLTMIAGFAISPKEPRFQPKQNDPTLRIFSTLSSKATNYILKFVYTDNKSKKFILNTVKKYKISPEFVWIMPEGITAKELEKKRKEVWKFCLDNGFNFSDRLQVEVFGKKRGI